MTFMRSGTTSNAFFNFGDCWTEFFWTSAGDTNLLLNGYFIHEVGQYDCNLEIWFVVNVKKTVSIRLIILQ